MEGIFVLPAADKWVLHAPLRGVTVLVNTAFLQAYKGGDAQLPGHEREVSAAPGVRKGPLRPEFLGLVTTRGCPLGCSYCDFRPSQAAISMPVELAAESVDWMVRQRLNLSQRVVDVHFFGGEPLFAFSALFAAVQRCRWWSLREGIHPWFEVSTSGFFSNEQLQFVLDHIQVVVLSLDGPPEIQDRYRSTRSGGKSSGKVMETALALGGSRIKLCLRCCVTSETVSQMPEIAEWFCASFRPSVICFEPLRPTENSEKAGYQPPAPWDFVKGFCEATLTAERFGVETVYGPALIDEIRNSFCPVGRDSLIVEPDGRVSACYLLPTTWERLGLPFGIGEFRVGRGLRLDPEALGRTRNLVNLDPSCQRCFARWHCAGGCHVEKRKRGGWSREDSFCIQTRLVCAWKLLRSLGEESLARNVLEGSIEVRDWAEKQSDRLEDWSP